ncbi:isochorismate synthase [Flavobacterium sp.]|uniref:isochorismate synthase n=1 Tax=Flavobacterium sp. TaxID=239 RepID=UPI00286D3479|nr:isochorismate synthase [Flavobacterium sp.]
MELILEKMKQHKKQNLPFVLFRKPNSKTVVGMFQENDHVYFSKNLQEKGFVFAPFEDGNTVVFPIEHSEINFGTFKLKNKKDLVLKESKINEEEKSKFISLVKKGVDAISNGEFLKVVLSRIESVSIKHFKIRKIFKKMLQQYPTAFCYCWFHPKIGFWMGATPETLLQVKENKFTTMSLAGTQQFEDNYLVSWQEKETKEQGFVTQYIIENLKNIAEEITVSSPYTTKAGNLLHLKTDIQGILKPNFSSKDVVAILHPTPAVCGLPKEIAKNFILENETYDREFYTGFLGELNHDSSKNETATDLYVNLRCMKINIVNNSEITTATLYIGCGITDQSNPENEWEETVNKSKTMKSIF